MALLLQDVSWHSGTDLRLAAKPVAELIVDTYRLLQMGQWLVHGCRGG
jgi:hypothetical protein